MQNVVETTDSIPPPYRGLEEMYSEKTQEYYEYERPEMAELLPPRAHRVLDVGCGGGAFGRLLKVKFGCEVWGVESEAGAAETAVSRLDRVITGYFGEGKGLPAGYFDCVYFNDVLEHIADPWSALRLTKQYLAPRGVVIASIPNMRHFPTLWKLIIRKQWRYTKAGILDRTHLRFFTHIAIEQLFTESGYAIDAVNGIRPFHGLDEDEDRLWRYFKVLNLIALGSLNDMRFLQYAVRTRPI